MTWIWTSKQAPPKDRAVLGLQLRRFANADWEWSEPYAYHTGCGFSEPDVWCELEFPQLPDVDARTKASETAERQRRIRSEIQRLEKELETA